jgi:hypothetical protein
MRKEAVEAQYEVLHRPLRGETGESNLFLAAVITVKLKFLS